MPSPPIHYLWIGPKPLDENAGQDTIGPDLMREKYPDERQPISFWCLDSEVERYNTHFNITHQGRAPIIVRGIETYISQLPPLPNSYKKRADDPDDLKEAFNSLVTKLKTRADAFPNPKDKIREWITIKESFAFFIQLKEEGYVMDSNAIPEPYYELEEKDSAPMKDLKRFSSLFVPERRLGEGGMRPDPWLMFFKKGDPYAYQRFHDYLTGLKPLLEKCEKEGKHIPMQTAGVRDHIASLWCHMADDAIPIGSRISFSVSKHQSFIETPIQIGKRYLGSHYDAQKTTVPLLAQLLVGPWHPQEFYYYAKRHPHDPFEPFEFDLIRGDLGLPPTKDGQRPGEVIRTTLIKLASYLKKYDDLGSILALSSDPLAVTELLKAPPKSRCMDTYFLRKRQHFGLTKEALFKQLKVILSLTDKIEGKVCSDQVLNETDLDEAAAPAARPVTLDALIIQLKENSSPSAHHALTLFATIGALTIDTLEAYVDALEAINKKTQTHQPTHFKPAPSHFNAREAHDMLLGLIKETSPKSHI